MTSPSRTLTPLPWPVLRVLLMRLAILAVVATCSLIVWWSISKRLLPTGEQVRLQTLEMNRLANDVQQLESNWTPAQVEKTELQFRQAQDRLFASRDALAQWQQELARQADALDLELGLQMGNPQPHPAARQTLGLQPVTIDLRPLPAEQTTNSPYRRVLQFVQSLQHSDKRMDLLDFTVIASSNSVRQAKLNLNLWTPGQLQP